MKMNIVLLSVVLLLTGLASANTVWNPAANPDPNLPKVWFTAVNWSNGLPTGVAADVTGKAVFNVAGAAECVVNAPGAICDQFAMGDGGTSLGNILRIADGGSLNAVAAGGNWCAVGYDRSATLIVEAGGFLQTGGRMGVGWFNDPGMALTYSYFTVDGGHAVIGGHLQVGGESGTGQDKHGGIVTVKNAGLLEIAGELRFYNPAVTEIVVRDFGTIIISGDRSSVIAPLIASGDITTGGSGGTVVYDYNVTNPGKTTIKSTDPMNRNPVYKTVKAGNVDLTWTNMAPVPPATDVWVDIWFGTDPNKLSANYTKVLSKGKNATSVTVSAPLDTEPTTYYWQVDSYRVGDPAIVVYDANNPVTEGLVTPFNVTGNTPPSIVINTSPTATWINQPISLDSTLTDDGATTVTYLWTATDGGVPMTDPNVVFSPSAAVADPSVTVNYHSGPFVVTVTVNDGFNPPVSAMVTHDCAQDACQATTAVLHYNDAHKGDVALDCNLNLTDFAVYARQWLLNYQLTAPVPN